MEIPQFKTSCAGLVEKFREEAISFLRKLSNRDDAEAVLKIGLEDAILFLSEDDGSLVEAVMRELLVQSVPIENEDLGFFLAIEELPMYITKLRNNIHAFVNNLPKAWLWNYVKTFLGIARLHRSRMASTISI